MKTRVDKGVEVGRNFANARDRYISTYSWIYNVGISTSTWRTLYILMWVEFGIRCQSRGSRYIINLLQCVRANRGLPARGG